MSSSGGRTLRSSGQAAVPPPPLGKSASKADPKKRKRGKSGTLATTDRPPSKAIRTQEASKKGRPKAANKAPPPSSRAPASKPNSTAGRPKAQTAHPRPIQVPQCPADLGRGDELEEDPQPDDEEQEEVQPGEDEDDYADVDLLNEEEASGSFVFAQSELSLSTTSNIQMPTWGRKKGPSASRVSTDGEEAPNGDLEVDRIFDDDDLPEEDGEDGDTGRSKLKPSQKSKQLAEQPRWLRPSQEHDVIDFTQDSDKDTGSEDSDEGSAADQADEDSIDSFIEKGHRYPALKGQPPRLRSAIKAAFRVSELKLAFDTPFPPPEDADRFYRDILRQAAREVEDEELAHQFKKNAPYGNCVAYLVRSGDSGVHASPLTPCEVKARFSKFRLTLRDLATNEAKSAYQLRVGCGAAVQALLLDDTFVYNVDGQGRVINIEPYRHPGVVNMLQFFFKCHKSIGQSRNQSFTSSISANTDEVASKEQEVPIPMLAFCVTMLRAELSLWKFGRRESSKFDADQHYTVYEHHVGALNVLKSTWPVRFHELMAFLYVQASTSSSSSAPKGCEGRGVLGLLGWAREEEDT
ncbi:hypothetical protein NMY22_g7860 [Coprinellus aureogranulatus]|nr:hypothetical protein NMY22_g7860 [Coprinellus aureogranulatus]